MIPHASLKLVSCIEYISILDISIKNEVGQHGELRVKILVEYEKSEDMAERLRNTTVQLTDAKGVQIFSGFCVKVDVVEATAYRELELVVVTHSKRADVEVEMNTYQSTSKTLLGMMQETYGEYGASITIDSDVVIPFTLSQKNETDWAFLKRIAAQHGKEIFVNPRTDQMNISIGEQNVSNQKMCMKIIGSHKDVHAMRTDIAALQITASSIEYEILDVEVEDITIVPGDMVNNFRVVKNYLYSKQGLMVNQLALQMPGTVRANSLESHTVELESQILTGTVEKVEGNLIQVSYRSDKGTGEKPWISYESAVSNSFYCMPDVGDEVFIYYDNTGQSICLGSKRSDVSDENFQTPDDKSMSFMGKLIKLGTDKVLVESKSEKSGTTLSSVTLNEEGIEIYSDIGIDIEAKEKVLLLANNVIEPTKIDDKIEKYIELRKEGEKKYNNDLGHGELDKIGLSLLSTINKAGRKTLEGIESYLYLDVLKNMFSDEEEEYDENVSRTIVESIFEIESLNSITLKAGEESYIQLASGIQIQTPHFEWLGTEKQRYEEVSVADTDLFDTILDGVQLALDVAGMFPICGFVPDLINAGISLLRGDFVGAGLSLVSALPGIGDAVGAAKIVGKTATTVIKAANVVKKFENFKKSHLILNYTIQFVQFGAAIVLGGARLGYTFDEIDNREGTTDEQDTADKWIAALNYISGIVSSGKDIYDATTDTTPSAMTPLPSGNNTRQNTTDGNGGTTHSNNSDSPNSDGARRSEHAGDPVNMVTGSLTIAHTDMNYNDILGKFPLVRTYESVYTNENQMLGNRWIYNVESRLYINDGKATVRMPDNHLEHFIYEKDNWRNEREDDAVYTLYEDQQGYVLLNRKAKKTYYYSPNGLLEFIVDRNGNRTSFKYVGTQLEKMTLASGVAITFTYEGSKLTALMDNIGREISYEYEGDFLTKVHYPNGATVQYEYDRNGNIISAWDENGQKYITNQYDRKGRVVKQLMADGEEYVYLYDDANKVNTILTVSNGKSVKYEYNRKNLVTAIVYQDSTREEKEYDSSDNVIRYKDRMGYVTTFTYDGKGNQLQKVLPNGLIWNGTYDEDDNLVYSSDNAGRENWFVYDKKGNLISKRVRFSTDEFGEDCYEYDDAGRVIAYIDSNQNKTTYAYDTDFSQPSCVTLADGAKRYYTYDSAGRRMSDDNGKTVLHYAYNPFDYKTSIIDEDGNTTKFVYDNACNLVKIIRPKEYKESALQGAGIEYQYDALQHLVGIVNPCGDVSAVQVNSEGAAVKEIHPNAYVVNHENGEGIENTYDVYGNKTHVKYPGGGVRRMIYNVKGLRIKDISPAEYQENSDDGAGYEYDYDSVGRMVQITDPNGVVIKRYVYNLAGVIVKEIDVKGMQTGSTDEERIGTVYEYNLCGWLTKLSQPVSYVDGQAGYRVTTYEYDKLGHLITEKRYLDVQTLGSQSGRVNTIYRKYDERGRLVRVTDHQGAEITYRYDENDNLTYESRKINDTHQQIRSWSYNKRGKVEQYLQTADYQSTKQKAARVTFVYDENANLIKKTLSNGAEIYYCYDAAGRVTEEHHKEKKGNINHVIRYEYDNAGNIITISDNHGIQVQRKFDMMNRPVLESTRNGATTMYIYGSNGKLEQLITPKDYEAGIQNGIRYVYDNCGRMTDLIAKNGETLFHQEYNAYGEVSTQHHAGLAPISFQYDFCGRRIESKTGENRTQSISYDAIGNISAVTDGNANTTSYEYDTWGRIIAVKRADGSQEGYSYDFAGNVILSVDGNGNEVHYSYNEINKLSQITWQDETTEEYLYDISGNLAKQKLRDGKTITYTYNMYQSLTSRRSDSGAIEESYQYDEVGMLKSAIAGGMRYDYFYYEDGSLKEKVASGRTLIAYEYDINGNIAKLTDISGKTVSYEYDDYNRINKVYDNTRLMAEYEYTLFGAKKRTVIPGIFESNYGYDTDANLTSYQAKTTDYLLADTQYQYDGNGNLTTKTGLYGEYTYGYDSLNRLTSECFEKIQTANVITTESYRTAYTYDHAGNRLSMEKNGILTEYTYDTCNRLISEKTGEMTRNFTYDVCGNLSNDGNMTYTYDELNRLAEITTQDGHVQKHRYDAEGLRHELEEDGKLVQFLYNHKQEVIAEESKEEGLKRYIRGLGLISSDCEQSKTYYHYVSDNVGSITHVLNENAETENEYQYDAFGNTIGYFENVINRFRYAGEQYDAVTSQYYLRARYYNPVIGRFTQQDTYLGAGLNLYAYCDNNPLSYIDPSGHNPESAAGRQDVLPSNIMEIPSVQRMIDSYVNAGANAADTYANATNNYIDTSVQSQSNAIYGDATSGADAGTLAPAPSRTESAPVPITPQSTALVPVAPMGSNPLVPVAPMGTYQLAPVAPMGSYPIVPYNANSNNPLITRQSMDVSNAVNDAGGRNQYVSWMNEWAYNQFYANNPSATLGAPGGAVWVMQDIDATMCTSIGAVARDTGMAGGVKNAYLNGEPYVYGIVVNSDSVNVSKPTSATPGVNADWNSNGRTAVNGDGFVIDTGVEEFVIEGGKPMPSGSYSFRMDDNGNITKLKEW